jgi:hypothetical protein
MLFKLRFREIAICSNVLRVTQCEIALVSVRKIDRAGLFFTIEGRSDQAGFNGEQGASQDQKGQQDPQHSDVSCRFGFLHQYEPMLTVSGAFAESGVLICHFQ